MVATAVTKERVAYGISTRVLKEIWSDLPLQSPRLALLPPWPVRLFTFIIISLAVLILFLVIVWPRDTVHIQSPPQLCVNAETPLAALIDGSNGPDSDRFSYYWEAKRGIILHNQGKVVTYTAPSLSGSDEIKVTGTDKQGKQTFGSKTIVVFAASAPPCKAMSK